MAQSALSHFLNNEIAPDEIETELYKAATEAFRRGWTFMEASFQIGGRAEDLGLESARIENVLRAAFDLEKRREYRKEELDEAPVAQHAPMMELASPFGNFILPPGFINKKRSSRYINIESAIIPWPSDEWRFDLAEILHRSFEPDELFGLNKEWDSPVQLQKVSDILGVRENIPTLMRSFDGNGAWIRINPAQGERETDVMSFRHVLLTVKGLELGKQLAFFKMFNLPCSALVNCGGKFIQGWVKVEAMNKEEYLERVTTLNRTLKDIGFDVDIQEGDPLAKACIPGILVEGKQQYLIEYESASSSWEEWQAWAEAYLDGDPLIETSMGYDEPPLKSLEVVEYVYRQGQKVVIAGPELSGKSMAVLDLALSVSQGEEWLGHSTEESGVLFVNLEQDSVTIVNRLYEISEEKEIEVQSKYLDFLHLMGIEKSVSELAEFLIKRIEAMRKWEKKHYSTVIIDGVDRLMGFYQRHQSEAGVAHSLEQSIDKIVLQTSCAVVLVLSDESVKKSGFHGDMNIRFEPFDESAEEHMFRMNYSGRHIEKRESLKVQWEYPCFKPLQ